MGYKYSSEHRVYSMEPLEGVALRMEDGFAPFQLLFDRFCGLTELYLVPFLDAWSETQQKPRKTIEMRVYRVQPGDD